MTEGVASGRSKLATWPAMPQNTPPLSVPAWSTLANSNLEEADHPVLS